MASGGYVKIYSNDGATLLFTSTNFYSVTDDMTVTETGVTLTNEAYTYSGDKKFYGLSSSANATEATKAVGFSNAIGSFTYYIVEGEEEKTPTLTYDLSQLDLAAGTHYITVRAKADGYADSEPSNAVEYVVEESVPTDLTGYTVTVPSNWTATAGFYYQYGYAGTFDFSTDGEHFETFSQIYIGYYPDFENGGAKPKANYITLGNYSPSYGPLYNDVPLYFKNFTEEYATDSTIIQWFVDNKATFEKTA